MPDETAPGPSAEALKWAARLLGPVEAQTPLAGDASTRHYTRLTGRHGGVLMEDAPFDPAASPFLHSTLLYQQIGLPVPAVLDADGPRGWILLEDVGDQSLAMAWEAGDENQRAEWQREALTHLEVLQQAGTPRLPELRPPYRLDAARMTRELEFTWEHFVVGYRGEPDTARDRQAFLAALAPVVAGCAEEPQVLCHRDYHGRNLFLHQGHLVILDHQDSCPGPVWYDAASLLWDPYVARTEGEREEGYVFAADAETVVAMHGVGVVRVAVQRLLKALGTFGYQVTVRQGPLALGYAAAIPRALVSVGQLLGGAATFPPVALAPEARDVVLHWLGLLD